MAQVRARELDARELVLALGDVVHLRRVDADLDRYGRQRVALALVDPAQHLGHWHVDDPRQPLQLMAARRPRLRQVGWIQLDRGARPVVDENPAVPVEDDAARRLQPDRAQLVVLGHAQVLVAGKDLERPQAQEERAERHESDGADDRNTQRELRR